MSRHFRIVAVGAGPAGISMAIECLELGVPAKDVLILEKGAVPIDAIRKFYPEKKMTIANYKGLPTETHGHISVFRDLTKAETVGYFDDLIKKYGLAIEYNSEVIKIIRKESHFEILVGQNILTADFVGIGIGILGRPNKPTYKIPNTLRNHILYDLTSQKVEGQKVLVVGGGDTSSEYCQVLVEEKNQVTLCYRGDAFGRMMNQNREAVERMRVKESLRVLLSTSIKEVQDQGGKPHIVFEESTNLAAETFDKVIYSIGGTTPVNFLKTIGVEFNADWPKVGEFGETNVPGLYLIGDLVAGKLGGSIIFAYNSSYRSAKNILSQISGASK